MRIRNTYLAGSSQLYGAGLFVVTLAIELVGVWPRYLLVKLLFWPISVLTAGIILFRDVPLVQERQLVAPVQEGLGLRILNFINSAAVPIAHIIAWGPLVLALLTLVFLPGGFLLTRFALGARKPSVREKAVVEAILDEVAEVEPRVRLPSAYYIIDKIEASAVVIGRTLFIYSGLLSEMTPTVYAYGMIAHQLGHLNSFDGRLKLALRRLVLYPVYLVSRSVGTIAPGSFVYSIGRGDASGCLASLVVLFVSFSLAIASGGIGCLLLHPLWAAYWRKREFVADQFAARLEQASALIQYLKKYTLSDVATPYFLSETPSNELRIDRLLHGPESQGTMPLPKRDAGALLGGLSLVFLVAFLWFGGARAIGLGPRIENSHWQLESYNYDNGTLVTGISCHLYFDAANYSEVSCFSDGSFYQRSTTYTHLDADTIYVERTEGTSLLPIYFGNSRYDLRFDGDRLSLVDGLTGYTTTWHRTDSWRRDEQ